MYNLVLMDKKQLEKLCKGCSFSANGNLIRPISGGPISVVLYNIFSIKMERDVAFILLLDATVTKTKRHVFPQLKTVFPH